MLFRNTILISNNVLLGYRYIAVSDPLRRLKEKYSLMCVNSALAVLAWVATTALVAPVASLTAEIKTIYITVDKVSEGWLSPFAK